MHPAYAIGALDASALLGLQKMASAALLREVALPAVSGAGLGAVGGAIAGGEGRRLEGALLGAGLGAGGAVAGRAAGKALGKGQIAAAEKELAKHHPDAPQMSLLLTPEAQQAAKTVERAKATAAGGELERGVSMLGGVGGAGAGMGIASELPRSDPEPMPQYMNPYGY